MKKEFEPISYFGFQKWHLQTIRKPTRQECGVGIRNYRKTDIKGCRTNHELSRYKNLSNYISPKYQSTYVTSC